MATPSGRRSDEQGRAFFERFRQAVADELFNVGYRIGRFARDTDQAPPPWEFGADGGFGGGFSDDPPF